MKKLKTSENHLSQQDKVLPCTVEIEKRVLGALMNNYSPLVFKIVKELFSVNEHQIIASAIINLAKDKNPVDVITVSNELNKSKQLSLAGGFYYLSILSEHTLTIESLNYYICVLYDYHITERIIQISERTITNANPYNWSDDLDNTINELNSLYPTFLKDKSKKMSSVITSTLKDILHRNKKEVKTYYSSGSPLFDRTTLFEKGITLIAGAGGIGKSTFVTWWMRNILLHNKDISILWITIDHESGASVTRKFLSSLSYLSEAEIQSKGYSLSKQNIKLLSDKAEDIKDFDIEFHEEPCSISDIDQMFQKFCKSKPDDNLKILLIDNIMRVKDNLVKSFKTETDDFIANTIGNIYKQSVFNKNKVHVIFLHHMTKEQLSSANHSDAYRPTIDMIKGSGRYVDVPETVILLNRPKHYPKLLADYPDQKNYLEKLFIVEIVKNTFGNTGIIYFITNMNYSIFKEI